MSCILHKFGQPIIDASVGISEQTEKEFGIGNTVEDLLANQILFEKGNELLWINKLSWQQKNDYDIFRELLQRDVFFDPKQVLFLAAAKISELNPTYLTSDLLTKDVLTAYPLTSSLTSYFAGLLLAIRGDKKTMELLKFFYPFTNGDDKHLSTTDVVSIWKQYLKNCSLGEDFNEAAEHFLKNFKNYLQNNFMTPGKVEDLFEIIQQRTTAKNKRLLNKIESMSAENNHELIQNFYKTVLINEPGNLTEAQIKQLLENYLSSLTKNHPHDDLLAQKMWSDPQNHPQIRNAVENYLEKTGTQLYFELARLSKTQPSAEKTFAFTHAQIRCFTIDSWFSFQNFLLEQPTAAENLDEIKNLFLATSYKAMYEGHKQNVGWRPKNAKRELNSSMSPEKYILFGYTLLQGWQKNSAWGRHQKDDFPQTIAQNIVRCLYKNDYETLPPKMVKLLLTDPYINTEFKKRVSKIETRLLRDRENTYVLENRLELAKIAFCLEDENSLAELKKNCPPVWGQTYLSFLLNLADHFPQTIEEYTQTTIKHVGLSLSKPLLWQLFYQHREQKVQEILTNLLAQTKDLQEKKEIKRSLLVFKASTLQ